MSEYWYDIKSDDADFDDEPVYANSEEVRQSIVEQQKYWLSLKFFIMKNQQINYDRFIYYKHIASIV